MAAATMTQLPELDDATLAATLDAIDHDDAMWPRSVEDAVSALLDMADGNPGPATPTPPATPIVSESPIIPETPLREEPEHDCPGAPKKAYVLSPQASFLAIQDSEEEDDDVVFNLPPRRELSYPAPVNMRKRKSPEPVEQATPGHVEGRPFARLQRQDSVADWGCEYMEGVGKDGVPFIHIL